jgi:hypothetical protein
MEIQNTENKHKRFIKTICESELVYGLGNAEGLATSSSIHYQGQNGEAIKVICFWAEKSLAKSCVKNAWSEYQISEIPLVEFMENWCVGMSNDYLLVGTEFDQNMLGFEAEPLKLILDLVNQLKMNEKDLKFKNFNGISDFEKQVKAIT